jgi:hypothetical protein
MVVRDEDVEKISTGARHQCRAASLFLCINRNPCDKVSGAAEATAFRTEAGAANDLFGGAENLSARAVPWRRRALFVCWRNGGNFHEFPARYPVQFDCDQTSENAATRAMCAAESSYK